MAPRGSMAQKIYVIIPAYNAEKTLGGLFRRFPRDVDGQIARYVVVDDGSTEGTQHVLDRLRKSHDRLCVLSHERNRGYGAAEKTLLRFSLDRGADLMILIHADGQYAPEAIPSILEQFDRGADLVQGSRMLGHGALAGGMPKYKYFANKALTWLENRAFGMSMAEFHSGYMCYRRSLVERTPFEKLSDSFDFDLEMIVLAAILEAPIHEVAIPTRYADEISHLNPIKYGLDVLGVIGRYRRGYYHRLLKERDTAA